MNLSTQMLGKAFNIVATKKHPVELCQE